MSTASRPHGSNTHQVPFVFAIDKSFLWPLTLALRSLARVYASPAVLEVFVLHAGELTDTDTEQLSVAVKTAQQSNIKLRVKSVDRLGSEPGSEINHPAYLRLAIPRLFSDYVKAIYLDADIVFVKSPHEMLSFDVSDAVVGVCQDIQNPTLASGIALPGWKKLGLTGTTSYFNSGVMIINIGEWNTRDITKKTIEFVSGCPEHLRFRDQDALNYLLANDWKPIPLKWNYPPLSALLKVQGARYYADAVFPLSTILSQESEAVIIHFVGPDKPWNDGFPDSDALRLYKALTTS